MSDLLEEKEELDSWTDIYHYKNCTKYYNHLLRDRRMIDRCEAAAKYSEKYLTPMFKSWAAQLGKQLLYVDLLSCYGNDTLTHTNAFYKKDFEKMWASEENCYTLHKPRQFPVKTFAADISAAALQYGREAGIFDETARIDFNDFQPGDEEILRERCRTANILTMNSLAYLNDGVFEQILGWFESGKEPGLLILAFNYPYDGVDRMRIQKYYLLRRFNFFNSLPLIHTTLTEAEKEKLGNDFGVRDRLFYEIWFLTRKR